MVAGQDLSGEGALLALISNGPVAARSKQRSRIRQWPTVPFSFLPQGEEQMQKNNMTRRAMLASGAAAAALPFVETGAESHAASPSWAQQKKFETVDGIRMAYYEVGQGKPIVFLHGNPTSSYLWRNVIPHVEGMGRCIAPDLVGMGDSDKLPDSGPGVYTYLNHRKYLFGLLEKLGVTDDVTFVIHDWGSALGFNWAYLNPDSVKGIAYMEALMRPPGLGPDETRPSPMFITLRSEKGEKMVLEDNMFVERLFLGELDLYLSEEDKTEYRRPFLEPGESRRPTLTWPREIVIAGDPPANDEIIRTYSAWLAETEIPKLFIRSHPGAIMQVKPLLTFARSLKNQQEVRVFGGHFVQEVSGDAIGRALTRWIPTLG
jgi:haloalkane dehalogenase